MTVSEIMEQAKTLTSQERKELVKLLVDTLDIQDAGDEVEQGIHWGQSLNQKFDEMDSLEMKYPEVDDPVEWIKHLRSEQRKHRLDDEA